MSGPPEASSMKPIPRLASQVFNLPVGIRNSLSGLLAKFHARLWPLIKDRRPAVHPRRTFLGAVHSKLTTQAVDVPCLFCDRSRSDHGGMEHVNDRGIIK